MITQNMKETNERLIFIDSIYKNNKKAKNMRKIIISLSEDESDFNSKFVKHLIRYELGKK